MCAYVSRDQKRALDSKKLVSQAIVSCPTGVLKVKPRSSGRASSSFTYLTISPAPSLHIGD